MTIKAVESKSGQLVQKTSTMYQISNSCTNYKTMRKNNNSHRAWNSLDWDKCGENNAERLMRTIDVENVVERFGEQWWSESRKRWSKKGGVPGSRIEGVEPCQQPARDRPISSPCPPSIWTQVNDTIQLQIAPFWYRRSGLLSGAEILCKKD